MMGVEHITATEEEKKSARKECRKLYNQIKILDDYTYKIITATIIDVDD